MSSNDFATVVEDRNSSANLSTPDARDKTELAFVDPNVAHQETLAKAWRDNVEAIVLEPTRGADEQIRAALESRSEVKAIHILAHGRPGELGFASGRLSTATLDRWSPALDKMKASLGPNGQVLLWSCSAGAGEAGNALVEALSERISASVFASSGFVGASDQGGSWNLDCGADVRPTAPPITSSGMASYPGLLALGWATTKTGVEGNTIALGTISGAVGTVTISQIPVGDTLIDGSGHSFTASVGNTSISLAGWTLSSLKIVTVSDIDFTLTATTTGGQTAQETVVVNPVSPTLAPVVETGVEGSPIALNLGASAKNLAGDSNSLATLTISAIPVGATLSDGVNTFTATTGHTSVSVFGWSLSSLTITPLKDANFNLSVSATQMDSQGQLSAATTATEAITVNPLAPTLAPVAETGVEGSPIALNLGAALKSLSGDANSWASMVVSAIPVGAVLSDGHGHSFTATAGSTSTGVAAWTLTSLKITPANAADFTLSIAATEKDAQGNLSTTVTASETVTVNPVSPTLAPVVETGVEGSPIALNLGASAKNLAGDSNSLATLTISAIPVGATLSDGVNTFTATTGHTSVSVFGWSLSSLTITPLNDANFSLSVSATQKDSQGQLSAAATATEAITVNPVAPTLAPVAETGVEGSPIALNLGASAKNLAGDSNSLATLTISAIPVGATLSDGVNTFTATTGQTSVSVLGWSLSSLTITPLNDANFSLSVSATQKDSQGQLSAAATATEAITVSVPPPPRTVIESSGSMSLLTDGTNYFLQPNGGTAVELSYGGAPVYAGEFAQYGAWTPIAAAQTASGYEVAWSIPGANQYQVWLTDSSGSETSIPLVGSGAQVASYEASFNYDLNGDGMIGVPPPPRTVIESSGSMSLLTDGTNYFLQPNGGSAVELSYNGAPVYAGEFAQYGAWTPIAAAQTASGYEVAWSIPGANQYQVWLTDSSGSETSIPLVGSGAQVASYEASFNYDLNGDGMIGVPPPPRTVIESSGSMSLLTDETNYFLQPNGGSAVELSYNGAPVYAGEFAQYGAWTPIAAAQTASGYEVAWSIPGANQYQVWLTDSSGNETSIPLVGSGDQVASYEASFNYDLNGDGMIGVPPPAPPQFVYQGTDASGAQVYDITNASGLEPFAVRVLTPQHPSANYPHSFLYDLPVESGLAQSTWGSGLDELAKLDVEDQYNATIVEPIFPIDSWYADNPNDPTINYETFVADILPQWIDNKFSTTGTEQNLAVGFSKSGYGALDLELKHPSVFSAVAAFDFPGDMTSYDTYGSSSANDYGTQANFQSNYEMNASFIHAHVAPFTSNNRFLISEGPIFQSQVADFDTLLTSQGVMHTLLNQTNDDHTWSGGWLSGAIAGLYGLEKNLNAGASA